MLIEGFFNLFSNILLLTSRVENNNSFPHPLCSEKEKECIDRCKNGDKEARDLLIKHNLRLVAYIAKKYNSYPDQDELLSVGTMGLIKAINTYEPSKGSQLATYASRCIDNEILMTLRGNKKYNSNVSLHESIGMDKEGNQLTLMDLLSVDEDDLYKKIDTEMLKNTLEKLLGSTLNEREASIIAMRYGLTTGEQMTQQCASEKLQISRSYVSRIEKKALLKLKAELLKKNDLF